MKVALLVVGWVDCWVFLILFIYLISVIEINKPQN